MSSTWRCATEQKKLQWLRKAGVACLLLAATAVGSPAQTFRTLVSFNGSDGAFPYLGSLVQDKDGNFYGTTEEGSANAYYGTVFKVTREGTLTTLYSFCSQSGCPDGANPWAGLVPGADGKFYGTTVYGGAYGHGTVFEITREGTLTTLHSFDYTDGTIPCAPLIRATDGNFYGTTWAGGANGYPYGYGTVFKISREGTLTTLHSFDDTDGAFPWAGLVLGADGNFYGTTVSGGAYDDGTVFKISREGTLTTLHSFDITDGAKPYAPLIQATDGKFYGTTYYGGTDNDGTVFRITREGRLTTLHSFDGPPDDGANPCAPLIQATDGKFYGTTNKGGVVYLGTVFSLTVGRDEWRHE